jgi:hypothetical protein
MSMRAFATDSEARRLGPALSAAHLLLGGCLFTPRPAPPPCDPATDPHCRVIVPPKAPLFPETVLANIKSGLQQKVVDPHIKDSLDETFQYIPDDFSRGQYPNYFDPWDKAREVRFMQKILESATHADSVTFSTTGFAEIQRISDDKRRYSISYRWTLVFVDTVCVPDTTCAPRKRRVVYRDSALWDFVGVTVNNVKLQQWVDLPPVSPSDSSSGFLRGDSNVR